MNTDAPVLKVASAARSLESAALFLQNTLLTLQEHSNSKEEHQALDEDWLAINRVLNEVIRLRDKHWVEGES